MQTTVGTDVMRRSTAGCIWSSTRVRTVLRPSSLVKTAGGAETARTSQSHRTPKASSRLNIVSLYTQSGVDFKCAYSNRP